MPGSWAEGVNNTCTRLLKPRLLEAERIKCSGILTSSIRQSTISEQIGQSITDSLFPFIISHGDQHDNKALSPYVIRSPFRRAPYYNPPQNFTPLRCSTTYYRPIIWPVQPNTQSSLICRTPQLVWTTYLDPPPSPPLRCYYYQPSLSPPILSHFQSIRKRHYL